MTEQRALPGEDLAAWPAVDDDAGYDDWYGANYELSEPSWDDFPPLRASQRPAPPWFRRPRLLWSLIIAAAAVLVVATALLVTGRFGGEIPTRSQLGTRTASPAPSAAPGTSASPSPGSAEPASSSPASATSSSAETSTVEEQPQEPDPPDPPQPSSAPPPPADPPPAGREKPQINVTRNPMSFTPGKS